MIDYDKKIKLLIEDVIDDNNKNKKEQIIITCMEIFDKIVEYARKFPEFNDGSHIPNIGIANPLYIIDNKKLISSSDFYKIQDQLNYKRNISLRCKIQFYHSNYDILSQPKQLRNFLLDQAEKCDALRYIANEIEEIVNNIISKCRIGNYYNDDFSVYMELQNGVLIIYSFEPVYASNRIIFSNLYADYKKILKYIPSLYTKGCNALRQYHKIIDEGWNKILNIAQRRDPELYDFLINDFVKDWNNYGIYGYGW